MGRFAPKQQISMVSMKISRIAVLAEITVLVEIANLVKIAISKEITRKSLRTRHVENIDIPMEIPIITPPRPRHGAFHPEIADFYGFHGNHKNRGFSEKRSFSGNRDFM